MDDKKFVMPKKLWVQLAKAASGGRKIDCSNLITLGGGKGLETIHFPGDLNSAKALFGEADMNAFIPMMAANYVALTAAGVTEKRSGNIAFFRALAASMGFYPLTVEDSKLPSLEVAFDAKAPNDFKIELVFSAVEQVYGTLEAAIADFPHMVVMASYFRQHFVHLWVSSGSHEKKKNKLTTACSSSSGSEKLFMFDEVVLRGVCHAMGFSKLYRNALQLVDTVSEPLRLRFWTAPAGAGIVPTTLAILRSFCLDPANIGKIATFDPIIKALDSEAKMIIQYAPVFAQHSNLYGVKGRIEALMTGICHALAPLLTGWLNSLSGNVDLKGQFVLKKDAAQAPETVAYFEALFTKERKEKAAAANLENALSTLVSSLKVEFAPNEVALKKAMEDALCFIKE